MPYIAFGRCYSDPRSDPSKKTYEQLKAAYRGKTIHGSRSLDQFYYRSLSDVSKRNKSQVATRYLVKELGKSPDWPILTVDQLWLWVVDEGK